MSMDNHEGAQGDARVFYGTKTVLLFFYGLAHVLSINRYSLNRNRHLEQDVLDANAKIMPERISIKWIPVNRQNMRQNMLKNKNPQPDVFAGSPRIFIKFCRRGLDDRGAIVAHLKNGHAAVIGAILFETEQAICTIKACAVR